MTTHLRTILACLLSAVLAGAAADAQESPTVPPTLKTDSKAWTPFQLALTPNLNIPPVSDVYGVKTGFMSGGGAVYGVEGTFFACCTPTVMGIQASLVNKSSDMGGFQFGLVDISRRFSGLQISLVNTILGGHESEAIPDGTQIGVVNYARNLNGFQFGLVNVIEDGDLPFMIIFNFNSTELDSP